VNWAPAETASAVRQSFWAVDHEEVFALIAISLAFLGPRFKKLCAL
jgi:hypothetical protein